MPVFRDYSVRVVPVTVRDRVFSILAPVDDAALLDRPAVQARFQADEYMPYWATLWPAALLLADEVAQWPLVTGETTPCVLELGCGLGLVALVAASRGYRVIASDYDADALAFGQENCRLNGVPPFETACLDWRGEHALRPDCILAADVLYERRNLAPIARFLAAHLAPAGTALLSDANRATADPFPELLRAQGLEVRTASRAVAGLEAARPVEGRILYVTRRVCRA